MRVIKAEVPIASVAEWQVQAGPKHPVQWAEGRSAQELAEAWFRTGEPAMPREFRDLLESRAETRGLDVKEVYPECQIRFDRRRGEPRNADLAFVGEAPGGHRVAVTVEAKADEPFGPTIAEALVAALEQRLVSPRSKAVDRIEDLVVSILRSQRRPDGRKERVSLGRLRYQLLAAVAGTLAFAARNDAPLAALVVHEFVTDRTRDARHHANAADLREFIERLGASSSSAGPWLVGPISIPGAPLFRPGAELLIGKVVTNLRSVRPNG